MNQVEKDASVSRNFHWSDTEVSCPGPLEFNAEIDISLTGQASLNSRYGIYIQGTVVPPAVSAAYVYFSADAKATGQFTLRGEASVRYDSSSIQFAKFGFPGLYYPGLLTIGPTLVISGYVSGEMSLSGEFTSTLSYTFPSVSFNFGKTDPDQNSGPVSPSSEFLPSIDLAVGYNVELTGKSGDLSIHLVPSLQLGLSVLGGAVIDAQAFVDIDLYAGVRINGSVSDTIAPNFCIGACTDGGLTGNVLYWETGPLTLRFYSNEQEAFGQCFSSMKEAVTIHDRGIDENSIRLVGGTALNIQPSTFGPAYIEQTDHIQTKQIMPRISDSILTHEKRDVPFLPGFLNCPDTDDHIGADGTDNDPYSDLNQNTLEDAMYRRRSLDDGFDDLHLPARSANATNPEPEFDFGILVKVAQCGKVKFSPLSYKNLGSSYFDLQNPTATNFDPTFSPHAGPAPGARATTYGREHIYEVQLISDFMNSLATQTALWQSVNPNFCSWLDDEVVKKALIPNLLHCLPYDSRIGVNPYMPWLESVANGKKASAIHGNNLATSSTWKKYSFTKKLSVMRSTAALASYMNHPSVRQSFISQSNCMKQECGVIVTGGINAIYTNFIRNVMSSFSPNLQAGLDLMVSFWDDAISNIDASRPTLRVAIDYGIAVTMTATSMDAVNVDLTPLQTFVQNNGLTWWNQL
ncbi:hypothetical protein DFH08DRAFT_841312 [Mycena albidolilacea]|uniref:Uncharacterized protein n=1 Tax=Mycena albidolilacea TaxID=1033008 RepID=A0AAD7AM21_9AGAR|nr:hypothetical protein DFH08DRAFT_841312 [Mycena albidolilacea]